MPQASELIVQFLQEAGIDAVFGIPGGGTGQILRIWWVRKGQSIRTWCGTSRRRRLWPTPMRGRPASRR